jgi:hypothetical protein
MVSQKAYLDWLLDVIDSRWHGSGQAHLHLSPENAWWDIFQMHSHATDSFDNVEAHEDIWIDLYICISIWYSSTPITQLTSAIMTIQSFASTRFISFIRVYILITTKQVAKAVNTTLITKPSCPRVDNNMLSLSRLKIASRMYKSIVNRSCGFKQKKGWLLLKEKIARG